MYKTNHTHTHTHTWTVQNQHYLHTTHTQTHHAASLPFSPNTQASPPGFTLRGWNTNLLPINPNQRRGDSDMHKDFFIFLPLRVWNKRVIRERHTKHVSQTPSWDVFLQTAACWVWCFLQRQQASGSKQVLGETDTSLNASHTSAQTSLSLSVLEEMSESVTAGGSCRTEERRMFFTEGWVPAGIKEQLSCFVLEFFLLLATYISSKSPKTTLIQ